MAEAFFTKLLFNCTYFTLCIRLNSKQLRFPDYSFLSTVCYHYLMSILTFEEHYVPRMWGGRNLKTRYGKPIPDEAIGEAWLISDHAQHTSVVNRGAHAGRTLHELATENPESFLGSRTSLTLHGRFPLLLKILDAQDRLSIQVHPDDAIAEALGEPDVGKTEMWHILDETPEGELYCGVSESITEAELQQAIRDDTIADHLNMYKAEPNASLFINARTIHAIGEGCMIAEIQQNSDLTYRISDWGRVDADGNPRELHIEKSLKASKHPNIHHGAAHVLSYTENKTTVHVLCACRYFASEEIILKDTYTDTNRGSTMQLFLAKSGTLTIEVGDDSVYLKPGESALVPAEEQSITLHGDASALMYYVPDMETNILAPLIEVGHSPDAIQSLIHD
ncbi:MAG: type I phosphomannose isomerase catalytic subunit [Candidatus Hydrogenedentota bacterium]